MKIHPRTVMDSATEQESRWMPTMRHIIVCIGSVKATDYQKLRLEVLENGGKPRIVRLPDGFIPIFEVPGGSYCGVDRGELVGRFDCDPEIDEETLIRELFKREYGRTFNEDVAAVLIGPDITPDKTDALEKALDGAFNFNPIDEPAKIIRIER